MSNFIVTAETAKNIAKHKPLCGRCGGAITSPRCVPNQQRMFQLGSTIPDAWWCTTCEAYHPKTERKHERAGRQMCDMGAYSFDTGKGVQP